MYVYCMSLICNTACTVYKERNAPLEQMEHSLEIHTRTSGIQLWCGTPRPRAAPNPHTSIDLRSYVTNGTLPPLPMLHFFLFIPYQTSYTLYVGMAHTYLPRNTYIIKASSTYVVSECLTAFLEWSFISASLEQPVRERYRNRQKHDFVLFLLFFFFSITTYSSTGKSVEND